MTSKNRRKLKKHFKREIEKGISHGDRTDQITYVHSVYSVTHHKPDHRHIVLEEIFTKSMSSRRRNEMVNDLARSFAYAKEKMGEKLGIFVAHKDGLPIVTNIHELPSNSDVFKVWQSLMFGLDGVNRKGKNPLKIYEDFQKLYNQNISLSKIQILLKRLCEDFDAAKMTWWSTIWPKEWLRDMVDKEIGPGTFLPTREG
jgi:hypothetical protein